MGIMQEYNDKCQETRIHECVIINRMKKMLSKIAKYLTIKFVIDLESHWYYIV